jgi:catechol 2,3-dioxygenase-like lactoylglutathione lyase family enzyme
VTPSVPFRLHRLDHVVLRVRDLQASLRFYRDAIGCTLEKEQKNFGLYQLRLGDALIDLVPVDEPLGRKGGAPPGREGRNLDHFAIQVTPFDESTLRTHLAAHGISVGEVGRRYGAEGYGPSIYIEDPDGNIVELKGPPERSEETPTG